MTTLELTTVSAAQGNETYPQRRLRFLQSEVFANLAEFLRTREEPVGLDSVATDPDLFGQQTLDEQSIDFVTPEDLDFFLCTIGDKSMPGTGKVRTFMSEDGCLQIDKFERDGLHVHVIDGDAVVVCVSNYDGAVLPQWAEAFDRCAVPVAIRR